MPEDPNVNLVKPPKPIRDMTDLELDAFVDMLFGALSDDVAGQGSDQGNTTP